MRFRRIGKRRLDRGNAFGFQIVGANLRHIKLPVTIHRFHRAINQAVFCVQKQWSYAKLGGTDGMG